MRFYLVFIIFILVLFVSGCVSNDTTTEEKPEPSITLENLSEFKEGIESINPENPEGFTGD